MPADSFCSNLDTRVGAGQQHPHKTGNGGCRVGFSVRIPARGGALLGLGSGSLGVSLHAGSRKGVNGGFSDFMHYSQLAQHLRDPSKAAAGNTGQQEDVSSPL